MFSFLQQLHATPAPGSEVQFLHAAYLFIHAIFNGAVLMVFTWRMTQAKVVKNQTSGKRKGEADFIAASANVLFLSAGMTAVMILVNDNIARAFAIGAAVALVRFRIKMAGKLLEAALFYSVLIGMACGVSRVDLAWTVTLVFGVVVEALGLVRWLVTRQSETPGALRLVAGKDGSNELTSTDPLLQEGARD